MTFAGSERTQFKVLVLLLGAVVVFAALDLISDVDTGVSAGHWATEAAIVLFGSVALTLVAKRIIRRSARLEATTAELSLQLHSSQAQAEAWRQDARALLQGLGEAIDVQFDRWGFSPAEKEVAMMLLKGLSHREIATVRRTTEATTRQQALAAYRKGGLSGRNELAAFFLEDLLLPGGSAESPERP